MAAHLAADARWTEQQHQSAEEQSRAEELREVAKRLNGEAAVVEASASDKRAAALAKRAEEWNTERAALEQQWSEAVERWEKLRYALGLPYTTPRSGRPTGSRAPTSSQGSRSASFSAP